MESVIYIKTSYKSVFLLNGTFVEKVEGLKYNFKEPLYITVLPLCAQFLPYTVKILGTKILANDSLCAVYSLPPDKLLIKLAPRYNYVYTPEHKENPSPKKEAEIFFFKLKSGNLSAAREMLTPPLNDSIDDDSLRGFFDDFSDIVKNDYTDKSNSTYYLIDKENKGVLFEFVMDGYLIENIIQV